ncbi:hypothetical protein ACHAPI_010603 [Fusarium lateritium]
MASDQDGERVLWSLGSRTSQGKLQQRYSRVLFTEKMEEQDPMIDQVSDQERKKMKRDFRKWQVWKDVRDVGRDHDDLGQFVTLCAFPGSMNSECKPKEYYRSLVADFKKEIESETGSEGEEEIRIPSSSLVRRWLREARPLCDAILAGPLPNFALKIDGYDSAIAGEVTDEDWSFYMSMDPAVHPHR